MVRAQDETPQQQPLQQQQQQQSQQQHQFVDPAMLKLLHKAEMNPNLFELDEIVGWDSPPDTPSSVSSDEDLFAAPLRTDLKNEWDALFHDQLDGHNKADSSSSVMWNFDLPLSHLDIVDPELFASQHQSSSSSSSSSSSQLLQHHSNSNSNSHSHMNHSSSAASSSAASPIASAAAALAAASAHHPHSMPDLDFSHGLEMDVFGLDSGLPPPPAPLSAPPSAPSSAASSHNASPAPRGIVYEPKKKSTDKRKSEDDSMEAKKARARQTRDEIVAKTQAALRQGCKADNPEMRRITHNVLERKRREDLKTSYQELRSFVPEVMHNDRAPTGQILGKAVDYIHALRAEEQELMQKIAALRQENERLRNRMF